MKPLHLWAWPAQLKQGTLVLCEKHSRRHVFLASDEERMVRVTVTLAQDRAPTAERECKKLRAAILWALGEKGSFDPRPEYAGNYWWRTELRRRAALAPRRKTK